MKGKIGFDPRMKRYYVSWYHGPHRKTYKVWFYQGIPLDTEDLAERILALMRSDQERGIFRIEKYSQGKSEVIPFLDEWIEDRIKSKAPSTYRTWKGFIRNHLKPFFKDNPMDLLDLNYGILLRLKDNLKLSEESKQSVMRMFHTALVHAKRLDKIVAVPEFPPKEEYDIVEKPVRWLTEERQMAVINAIPNEHQPIFMWLKLHMRRPMEAAALLKTDFRSGVFYIERTYSGGKLHDRTKVKKVIEVPCTDAFLPYHEYLCKQEWWLSSPCYFVNPRAWTKDKHYNHTTLTNIWNKACKEVGEDINLYAGLKHSSVSQLINEYGYDEHHIQLALDCDARTVKHYSRVEVAARKDILDKKILPFSERVRTRAG